MVSLHHGKWTSCFETKRRLLFSNWAAPYFLAVPIVPLEKFCYMQARVKHTAFQSNGCLGFRGAAQLLKKSQRESSLFVIFGTSVMILQ
jgi:hypothetical protein